MSDTTKTSRSEKRSERTGLRRFLISLAWVLGVFIISLTMWLDGTFGTTLASIVNTITGPVTDAGNDTLVSGLRYCVPPTAVAIVVLVLFNVLTRKTARKKLTLRVAGVLGVLLLIGSLVGANLSLGITNYIALRFTSDTFYEDYFADPADVEITAPEQPRNVIYIYLESMETTYASQEVGGAQPENNYMPRLTQLAADNISFSDGEGLGGFHPLDGASWTMGALMATSSGVTYELDTDSNDMVGSESFCSGLITIGDVLDDFGYTQEFLCGSGAEFAGRDIYFTQHGGYKIMDRHVAEEVGYIPPGYYDGWWGFEDYILFDVARSEVTELAASGQPFNLTMLTVDTHHVGGHTCAQCGDAYETDLENVVACTDQLVWDFVAWCQQQDWYENTTIVITGDHPRMDTQLVDGVDRYDRTVYNCIINAPIEPVLGTVNREFSAVDMFPTTLAAMGFAIDGDRLGLGTSLFGHTPTLCEEYSFQWLDEHTQMRSDFYQQHFAPELG